MSLCFFVFCLFVTSCVGSKSAFKTSSKTGKESKSRSDHSDKLKALRQTKDGRNVHQRGRLEGSEFRLEFLSGFTDDTTNNMCYKYKLHNRQRRYNRYMNHDSDDNSASLTWSMQICTDDYVDDIGMDLGDFLIEVRLAHSSDSYSIDSTHLYYSVDLDSYYGSDEEKEVILCFSTNEMDDYVDEGYGARGDLLKLVSKTEYCLQLDESGQEIGSIESETICSERGIFTTGVCGMGATSNSMQVSPYAIDYVPETNHVYNISEENEHDTEHGGNSMVGSGTYELNENLIVLRAWWIDECITVDNDSNGNDTNDSVILVVVNDNYFDTENGSNRTNTSLVGSPVTIPIYDIFILSSECQNIKGIITDFEHDEENEEYLLWIDTNVSPLMFFKSAAFEIEQLSIVHIDDSSTTTDETSDSSDVGNTEKSDDNYDGLSAIGSSRRLSDSGDESYTLSVPIGDIEMPIASVEVAGIELASCDVTISPSLDLTFGLSVEYETTTIFWTDVPTSLDKLEGSLSVDAGVDASLECSFLDFEDIEDDGYEFLSVGVEISGIVLASIGPFWLELTPSLGLSLELTDLQIAEPVGMEATLSASGGATFVAGWSSTDDLYAGVSDNYFEFDHSFEVTNFSGYDYDNVEIGIGLFLTPSVTFGASVLSVVEVDLLEISAPLGLPEVTVSVDSGENDACSSEDASLALLIDFDLTASVEVAIPDIEFSWKVWTWTLFEEISYTFELWTESLYSGVLCLS